jgi:glycosyltransferase involved in cell wall biosynthesis
MLDSIMQQTYKDFYVIIYNNGSTDNTEEVIKPYLQNSNFSYSKSLKNDPNFASNIPFAECITKYFMWVHDDDIMHPDLIKEELAILENNEDVGLVTVNSNYIDENDKIFKYAVYAPMSKNDLLVPRQCYFNLFISGKNIVCCPAVMYRMSIMKKYNVHFHLEYGGACDVYQWMEINQYCNIYYISKILFNYRIHQNQVSRKTLVLDPLLKKPVLCLLENYDSSAILKKKWLEFINRRILNELSECYNIISGYKTIRQAIFLPETEEYYFRFRVYLIVFFPYYKITMRVIRKLKRILKLILKG